MFKKIKIGIVLILGLFALGSAAMLGAGASSKLDQFKQGNPVREVLNQQKKLQAERQRLDNELDFWKTKEYQAAEKRKLVDREIADYQRKISEVSDLVEQNICSLSITSARASVIEVSDITADSRDKIEKFCSTDQVPDFLQKEVVVKKEFVIRSEPDYEVDLNEPWVQDMQEQFENYYN